MVNTPNKLENNLNFESQKFDNLTNSNFVKNQSLNSIASVNEEEQQNTDTTLTLNENIEQDSNDLDIEKDNAEVANCLALTVKKDYSLSIAKNVFFKTFKSFWKIAVSLFTLNFLKFFL